MVRAHAGPQKLQILELFYFFKMNKIQTLIFDFGGVIINLKTEQEWLEEDLLPNFYPEQLQALQQQGLFQEIETGKISAEEFIQQLKSIAINKSISDEEIIRHWNGILKDIPKHRLDFLKELKRKYKLILLSNTNQIHKEKFCHDMIRKFGEDILEANFDTVYYSHNIGLRKPHKEIYEFVMKSQNIEANEILFLDDKVENLLEPQNLGWNTIHVTFNGLTANEIDYKMP